MIFCPCCCCCSNRAIVVLAKPATMLNMKASQVLKSGVGGQALQFFVRQPAPAVSLIMGCVGKINPARSMPPSLSFISAGIALPFVVQPIRESMGYKKSKPATGTIKSDSASSDTYWCLCLLQDIKKRIVSRHSSNRISLLDAHHQPYCVARCGQHM